MIKGIFSLIFLSLFTLLWFHKRCSFEGQIQMYFVLMCNQFMEIKCKKKDILYFYIVLCKRFFTLI